jgi:hypothetical protein
MVTHNADSKYIIIIGIVVDVFVIANRESFIILSSFISNRLFLFQIVAIIISSSREDVDVVTTSFGIRADK